jgi:hypothetical protein
LALVVGAAITPGLSDAAPQTFNTALPVGKGDFVFREQFLYIKASDDPSAADRNLEVFGGVSVLGHGVSRDLALFGVLPYLDKELDLTTPGGQRITRGARGVGDAQFFARYTMFQKDGRGSSFRVAPFIGIKLPTGDDDDSDGLARMPQPLQSGSGSWDPFVGVVATYQTLEYEVDTQISYKANTAANGFQFGDEFRHDTSLQYRLLPRELGVGVPGFLYGVIEANLLYQAKNKIGGINDPDSGGTMLFLSPGLQYVTKRWILEAIVQLPVVQDLNGAALEDDYAVRAGFRVNF